MSELYANKVCLSPMVRAGTLPLRLVSLRYGADLVYGEEIVDKRIISAVRVPNEILKSVDFISRNGDSVVFRTCPEETEKVIFQIGTADAVLALKAAEAVARDVAAVDINMGCPKHFSVQGGMGAALLRKPEIACDRLLSMAVKIIKTLRRNLTIPVSCKIRLLPNMKDTIDTAKRLEDAGAHAVGVHMRQIDERPRDKASWEKLAPIVSALSVPVLANGDIFMHEDIDKLREISGVSSFLIARGALANPSIFRKEGRLPVDQMVRDYLLAAAEVDNVFQNTKYNVMRMIPSCLEDAYARGNHYAYAKDSQVVTVPELAATKSGLQMYSLWGLHNNYNQYQDQFRAKAVALKKHSYPDEQTFETLVAVPGAHALYAEALQAEGTPKAYNNCMKKPELFCEACKIQLLSEQDVKLHYKGRKHKNVLRRQTSATIFKFVAKAQLEQQPTANDTANNAGSRLIESGKSASDHRKYDGEDERDIKRLKA
ncbi:hypothetical protein KXD40_008940 [Peronospora effusa]|uniref:U1-type domain-containing protein n=1 Tax=Peronospora effusa TaxID=542832 RepID=A0A3M6V884_9STRA|nr:hypothetical protein DD238_007744 [Peronospora effusa]UIZ22050.1 hypothetical protein KXD40_008940 [Peronospora effusa]